MMPPIFLVTGATGNVGAEVVPRLPQTKQTRLAVRNIDSAREQFGDAVDYVYFDFMDIETIKTALADVSHLFLVRPPMIADVEVFKPIIACAKEAEVQQIVFLSIQGVEKISFVPHSKIEILIRESGIGYTFLRAGFFMQNLNTTHLEDIRRHDEIFLPAGRSKTAFIDVRDIGAVGAKVMLEDGHTNQIYTVTGSQALDYFQVADLFTEVLGHKITYRNPSILTFIWRLWRRGNKLSQILLMVFLYTMTRFGQATEVNAMTPQILGYAPITMRQFISDCADDFAPTHVS